MGKIGNLRVLVRPLNSATEEKKIGSIIVPVTVRHKMELMEGEVVETGLGTPDIPMEVKVGERVMFKDGESRLRINGCVVLEQEDILMILP